MAQYSVLDENQLAELIHRFNVGKLISAKLLSGGSQNTNFKIKTATGAFVLSICEDKSDFDSLNLAKVLLHLKDHGFRTSEVVPTRFNELITFWRGKPTMLKRFLSGKLTDDLSLKHLQLIGTQMAKLHGISAPEYLPKHLSYGKEYFDEVKAYKPVVAFSDWLDDISKLVDPILELDLPKALIHADLFPSNVILSADENTVTIMDFEEATSYYRIFDLGMAIIGSCSKDGKVDLTKVSNLIKGYQQVQELTTDEKQSLRTFAIYAGAAMSFWRHRQFNHLNPDPKMYDHYLGLKVLADDLIGISEEGFQQEVF